MTQIRPAQNILTRLSADMLADFRASGYWGDQSIYEVARAHAHSNPNKAAIRDSQCTLSYKELIDLAEAIAADLAHAGLRPGDRVAAWMSSRVEMATFLLACSRNGYVFSPSLHRNHTVDEIATLLERMTARALVAEENYGADADTKDIFERTGALGQLNRSYRLSAPSARTAETIRTGLALVDAPVPTPTAQADDVVYLAFTSGTTGDPKGVMHTNNTLLANARALAKDWNFGTHSVSYTMGPLSHNLGFGALILTLLAGGELLLHDLPRGASLLERLQSSGATFLFGVPAHALDFLDEIERSGGCKLDALKGFRISGAAVPHSVVERLLSHGIVPQSGYGMTEAGSHHYTRPDDGAERVVKTSGRAAPGYEIRIFSADDDNSPMATGEVGHIGGRGASLMLGYFGNQPATESSFNKSGWFMTGDLGRVDEDGYLQITGRIKDVIIRGGHNIHPAKIELLAMRHPHVERAVAIPVKDERLGEKVCLVVMARNGQAVDPEQLLSHLHVEGLSRYDMPEYFLQVAEIPLSASGKILKRAVLPWISNGDFTPQPVRWRA